MLGVIVGVLGSSLAWSAHCLKLNSYIAETKKTLTFNEIILDSQRRTIEKQKVLIDLILEVLEEEKNRKSSWAQYEE